MRIPLEAERQEFRIFEATPGKGLLLLPDSPSFTIVALTTEFLAEVKLQKENVVGTSGPEWLANRFSCSPDDVSSVLRQVITKRIQTGITLLRAQHSVGDLRITNVPVIGPGGDLEYIIQTIVEIPSAIPDSGVPGPSEGIEKAYRFFMKAPVIIGYVKGDNYVIDFANEGLLKVWGRTAEVIGKPLLEAVPELRDQGISSLLDRVRQTGEPFFAYGHPLKLTRNGIVHTVYFDFVYQPFYEEEGTTASGVISVGYDVTSQVLAKKQIHESELKWHQLANAIPAIVWAGHANGNIYFLNEQWYAFTGLAEDESIGFGWTNVVHPDDLERCLAVWDDARKRGVFYEVEVRYRSRHGNYRWMIARGVPVKSGDKLSHWYGTCSDIHERKELQLHLEEKVRDGTREVLEKKSLLDNILQHSSNGISVSEILFDSNGKPVDALTILANDAAVQLAGIPRELYLTKRATELEPDIMSSDYGKACLRTLETGEPAIMQYFMEFSSRWLELTISRMDDHHLIHIFTDVTTVKLGQLQLERSLEDLKNANANLEQFAYAASHDLKEPVRKIQFFANRLKVELEDQLTPGQLHFFNRLENSTERMRKLIDDLLEYSQANRGSTPFEDVNLHDCIKAVLEDLELEIQRTNAEINSGSLPVVRGNRRQLQQLFQNLISNGIKYSKPGTNPVIFIEGSLKSDHELGGTVSPGTYHLISVSDRGIGFDPSEAEMIFNVFTRLHSTSDYRGSGVGLSIVRRVAESHGGYAWATSSPEGSVFHVALPENRPDAFVDD